MRHHDLVVAIISRFVTLAYGLNNGGTRHRRGYDNILAAREFVFSVAMTYLEKSHVGQLQCATSVALCEDSDPITA
jgi:hypothetical protein